jgi:hypothetical protein
MNPGGEPEFLSLEIVHWLHRQSLVQHGGLDGVRDAAGIEAAPGAAQNAYFYAVGTASISLRPMRFTWLNLRRS